VFGGNLRALCALSCFRLVVARVVLLHSGGNRRALGGEVGWGVDGEARESQERKVAGRLLDRGWQNSPESARGGDWVPQVVVAGQGKGEPGEGRDHELSE